MEKIKEELVPQELKALLPGITKEKQEIVINTLEEVLRKTSQWERQLNALVVNDHEDLGPMKVADVVRKNAKKYKVDMNKAFTDKRSIVQAEMESYKNEDKFWLKSKQIVEAKLKLIEADAAYKANTAKRHAEEVERLKNEARLVECLKYSNEVQLSDIDCLDDKIYATYLGGLKIVWEKEQEELRLAEVKDKEEEKARAIELEKAKKEAERLKLEAEKVAKEQAIKDAEAKKIKDAEILAQALKDAETKRVRDAEIAETARLKKIQDDKLAAIEEKARLVAKELAEKKAQEEALALKEQERLQVEKDALEALKKAPEKEQLLKWVESFVIPGLELDSPVKLSIETKFKGFIKWAKSEIK